MFRLFRYMMPKEERFFDLFAQHAEVVVAGAEALRAMLEGGERVAALPRIVMERENEADEITREVLMAVRRTFITPFDRGNIKDLITSMDNAIDQMQKTAKTVMLFEVRDFTPQMREMGDAIVDCAKLVREAMPLLRSISAEATSSPAHRADLAARGPADELHDLGLKELYRRTEGRTRWTSSSATRSTIIWKRWSTASTTSATRSTAS